jgi:cytoskeleton protein RodZ
MKESSQQSTDADLNSPIGGARLAIARRENGISAREIAKELHLDEPTIRALEQNDFEVFGAPVFVKGHLRKYAELVGVPIDDILSDYYQLNRSAGAPPLVGLPRKSANPVWLASWIAIALVLTAGAIAAYWWYTYVPAPPVVRMEPGVRAPLASDPVVRDTADDAAEIDAVAKPVAEPEDMTTAVINGAGSASVAFQVEPGIAAASKLPQVRIELSFFGDCWTEVFDASGRRLFYDLGTAGRVVALSGDGPLQIVLGESENVSIAVAGMDYPMPRPVRPGGLTRLTINSQ